MRTLTLILLMFLGPAVSWAQQTDVLDILQISAQVLIYPDEQRVVGTPEVHFRVLRDTDSIYLDGVNMKLLENESTELEVVASEKKIWLKGDLKAGNEYTALFSYEVFPKKAMYFTEDQFWTQGQGKYTSHWLPSIDDMNDKIQFDIQYLVPGKANVIANGKLDSVESTENGTVWSFDMQEPMSSYLVAVAGGSFDKLEIISESGIPIELYYRPEDSSKAEPTYRYTKEIFDFLEKEIGVPYPWQNYKQVPVRDFLYAGMENTTATIFSEAFVVDSIGFVDRNYVNVNAHEMAHQWFGNLVTETEGTHHWLHEGFATYYALLAEREIFGEDYYYWKLLKSAEELQTLSRQGEGESLLDPKASSLTFYEKGAWALHLLKELIGEQAFKNAVIGYLNNYRFKNVTTDDFLREVKKASVVDITQWEADWLQQTAFQAEQAYNSLIKNDFIVSYFEVAALRELNLEAKLKQLEQALTDPNDFIGQEGVYQLANTSDLAIPLYKKAFESGNLLTRQAIALSMERVPSELKPQFESLLDDASYLTKELALRTLYANFPGEVRTYLEKTKYLTGFQNKNIKLMWLAIAIYTEAYGTSASEIFISELKGYTSPKYSFEVRQLAFEYVKEFQLYDTEVLRNLVNACDHHYWRFRAIVREMTDSLLKEEDKVQKLRTVLESIPQKEGRYVRSKLNPS